MNKYLITICLVACSAITALGQNISGVVKDINGNPLKGAKISAASTPVMSTITDDQGRFVLDTKGDEYLEITFADVYHKVVSAKGDENIIQLTNQDRLVKNDVVRTSVSRSTHSFASVYADQLEKNKTNTTEDDYLGLIAGLNGRTVRGIGNALQIVDGFERTISNVNPEDIESVTVLKDGAALALYGVRGANGVIIVNTKHGQYNSFDVEVEYKRGMQIPFNMPKMLDAASYAMAVNEALYYDKYYGVDASMIPAGVDPKFSRYSQQDINLYAAGQGEGYDPDLYPNVDWLGEGLRDRTVNNSLNLTFKGGGKASRYYTSINYQNDFGLLNPAYTEQSGIYDTQDRNYRLCLFTNMDVDLTASTLLKIGMQASLAENTSPKTAYEDIFNNLYEIPSAAFPVYASSGEWGGDDIYKKNPIAQIAMNGYNKTNMRMLRSNMQLQQDLSALMRGLKAEVAVAFDNTATYQEKGTQSYAYQISKLVVDQSSGDMVKETAIAGINSALDINTNGLSAQYMRVGFNGNLSWNRRIDRHNLGVVAQYRQESYIPNETATHRQHLVGMVSYNYSDKYLIDAALNYSGSSVLPAGNKFIAYPSVSTGWIVSNESLLKDNKTVSFLKLRASVASVGYDYVPALYMDKQYWVGGSGYTFGPNANINTGGLMEGTIANPDYTILRDTKYNFGVDACLFNKLSLTADAFYTQRRKMFVNGGTMISSALGLDVPQVNEGANDYKGLELSARWEESKADFRYYIGANVTLLGSKIIENGEGFKPEEYLYKKGDRVNQIYGLEMLGYFNSWDEINNPQTPTQLFSDVRPGDIRYKDQNNDGYVDQNDIVKVGGSSSPLLYGGINMGIEYKGFGIDMVWSCASKFDERLNLPHVNQPLRNNNNISTWYWNDNVRWTEDTKQTANLPRLSTLNNPNNYQMSSQWLADGSFLKLSSLIVRYNLPQNVVRAIKLKDMQIYAAANDLLSFDHVKYATISVPEMRSLYAGIKIKF